jgi:hypothetical protein
MSRKAAVLLAAIFAVGLILTDQAYSDFGPRFGPFKYFAPYYFPSDGCCRGLWLKPEHYRPLYEDPNPTSPGEPTAIQPQPRPKKKTISVSVMPQKSQLTKPKLPETVESSQRLKGPASGRPQSLRVTPPANSAGPRPISPPLPGPASAGR